jgi:SAM-dependent methyltransferase
MLDAMKKLIDYYIRNYDPIAKHGEEGVKQCGHRGYIGGDYEREGNHQLAYCLDMGLKPSDVFLDIGCGALRLGGKLLPYLDEGNYIGMDREQLLIDLALKHEIDPTLVAQKKPHFIITDCFEFDKLPKKPTFCFAFSLFTHLAPSDIKLCLKNLRPHVDPGTVFYATFGDSPVPIPQVYGSHSHRLFVYTHNQMYKFGKQFGFVGSFIGNEYSPFQQRVFKYIAV